MLEMARNRTAIVIGVALAAMTSAVFHHALQNGFVDYDDNVTGNPHVETGLSVENVRWAFTTFQAANWHPLTWLSWQLDAQLYGPRPWGFHLTNVLLHAANTVLLFAALLRMTGAAWPSAWVAAFFGVHPLHVESVAWVAERKDTLSTLFWMVALVAYARYAERPTPRRYVPVFLATALGLMAKPMVVTLPCVLLLLDYWPLRRGSSWGRLVIEKLPLFALAAAAGILTLHAQRLDRAFGSLEQLPVAVRVANALNSYVGYLVQTAWPFRLSVFYPHPAERLSWACAAAAAGVLATVSYAAVRWARRLPYFFVGWFWYLGTLVPVIGLVQVGSQAMADRYTYVPLIGVFIAVAWGVAELASRGGWRETAAAVATVLLAVCLFATWLQVNYWHDDVALWRHALECSTDNVVAHQNLGVAYARRGRPAEAVEQFQAVLRLNPDDWRAYLNLRAALVNLGQPQQAARLWEEAVRLNPRLAATVDREARRRGTHPDPAVRNGAQALELAQSLCEATGGADARYLDTLAAAYAELGRFTEARAVTERALAVAAGQPALAAVLRSRLSLYESGRPLREEPPGEAP
jgi:tetratricopeptide (TPR) repeat protein